ncbi:tail tape measure protein [Maridesulfovibrio sp.]|uniref:tail tape measure protein n=1 Tax=Maridesulfovibrio sp. TaxID=2795000 RepID=UPI0029CAAAB6|nr:tail tape measure protein [Maridesulfovibrio sp.]
MKEMVAGIRLTARTDSKLTRALNDTERGMTSVGKAASRQARVITLASQQEQRATRKTARETSALSRSFDRAGQAARRYGQKLKANLKNLRATERISKAAGRGLDALDNRYAGLVGGVATGATAVKVGNIQERFTRLAIQAGITDDALTTLKDKLYVIAQDDKIRVKPDEMVSGIEAIVEKTGDLKFAEDNIRNIGVAMQATGAAGLDIGELFAEFQKMGITAPEDVMKALDTLNVQGKAGAFTLQNLAALGPRVITAYTSAGRGGVDALKEMGAALQMIRQGTGSSEMAATAFEAVMRTVTDPAKIKQLEKMGIELFDPDKLAEGKRVLRPINELMKEIVQSTAGDKVALGTIFDAEAIRAFNTAASEYQKNGQINSLDKFMAVEGDGKTTVADAERAAKIINSSWTSMLAAAERWAENKLTAPLQEAATIMSSLGAEGTNALLNVGAIAAASVGALLVGRKARGFFKRDKGSGGASIASTISEGITSTSGITPVKVVNWPEGGSSFGDSLADLGDGKKRKSGKRSGIGRSGRAARTASKSGRFSKLTAKAGAFFSKISNSKIFKGGSKFLGKAAAPVGMALNALDLFGAVSSGDSRLIGGSLGGMAGSAGGAMAGAALGSVVPVIGTAIGGILGAVLGSYAGEFAGSEAAELVTHTETNNIEKTTQTESTQTQAVKEVHKGDEHYNFYITQQPGESAETLARRVAALIQRKSNGALHDGV